MYVRNGFFFVLDFLFWFGFNMNQRIWSRSEPKNQFLKVDV